ncbi:MAG: hypothetical protein H0U46_01670 [Actinobacteria bacterium]|nr:hypothetical protein [Actinomycetota bacterium]
MTTVATIREAAVGSSTTDAGNAEFFVSMFGDVVRFDFARKRWLIWDSHRWRPDDDAAVSRMALESVRRRLVELSQADELEFETRRKLLNSTLSAENVARQSALLRLAATMTPVADSGRGWDATPGVLGVPNGVVDLRTGVRRDGRRDDRITMHAGAAYDPSAQAPRWEQFLVEVFDGDDDLVRYVQRLAGYSLTGEATEDIAAFLMGVGNNGKTTLLTTLREAAGDYGREISAIALSSETRAAHSTEVTDLAGCRLASCEEMGDRRVNSDRLKSITGGGDVTARRMREDTITFTQTWALWITTNGLPRTDDNSVAFWRRVKVIPFDVQFDSNKETDLEQTLRAERPGILRWMVTGAVDFYREGLGEEPAAVREATSEYREDIDPTEVLFESGVLIADPEARSSTSDIYVAYCAWARLHQPASVPLFGEAGFAKLMGARFARDRIGPRRVRGFKGVRVAVPGDAMTR